MPHGVVELERYTPLYGAARRRLQLVKVRGLNFRDGYHDFNIQTGGIVVYPRLVAARASRATSIRIRCRAACRRSTRCSAAASTAARAR